MTNGSKPPARGEVRDDANRFSESTPEWFDNFVRAANLAVLSFGLIGLLAAVAGMFIPLVVLPIGALVWFGLWRARSRAALDERPRTNRIGHSIAVTVVAFVALNSAYSLAHRSEHVEINRDPGFYVNAAKWLAIEGELELDADVGPFADHDGLAYSTPGLRSPAPGTLQFQGNHLLPVLLGGAGWLGDGALFAAPIALGALALLTLYGFLAARTTSLAALAGTVALGTSLLWVAFARDAYTEVPSLGLLAFALASLPASGRVPARGVALHIGVALGALCALRIDAPLLLLLWPLVVAGWWRRDSVAARPATAALLVGFLPALAVALVDLFVRSPEYLHDLAGRTAALWTAFMVVVGAAIVAVAVAPVRRGLDWFLDQWHARRGMRGAAAFAAAGALTAIWFARPALQTVHGPPQRDVAAMQQRLGITVDITRKYSEYSFAWQAWYLGAPLVVLAVAGFAWMVWHRPTMTRFAPLLFAAAPASILYLYRPNIFPDHAWVMRRFLTTLTFAVVAAATVALDAVSRRRRRDSMLASRALTAIAAAALVVAPLVIVRPVRAAADQAGYLTAVESACATLGDDAAVLVLRDDADALYKRLPASLRGWCRVPVAIAGKSFTPPVLHQLDAEWDEAGGRLFVVGLEPVRLAELCPDQPGVRHRAENRFLLEQTLTEVPNGYSTQSLEFVTVAARDCRR